MGIGAVIGQWMGRVSESGQLAYLLKRSTCDIRTGERYCVGGGCTVHIHIYYIGFCAALQNPLVTAHRIRTLCGKQYWEWTRIRVEVSGTGTHLTGSANYGSAQFAKTLST